MKIPTIIVDNQEFYNMWQIKLNNNLYCFLIDVNDRSHCLIRKLINDGINDYICGLDNETEFNQAMQEFVNIINNTENIN